VTNGSGWDRTDLVDTNVGGSVKVSNGLPDANGTAGNTLIYNFFNATTRSVIGGSVSVAYIAGNTVTWDGIFETHVLGNVTFNHGTGVFTTHLDAVKIGGKLTLTGTGANQINLGTWSGVGLIVGGPMTVLGGPAIDTVTLNKVAVGGATLIKLGDGPNTVTINDSDFGGIFTLITGAGEDTINLDTGVGTSTATTFVREVRMFLGDGVDTVNRAGNADANQRIVFYRTFVIRHGLGGDVFSSTAEKEIAPFGGFILWLV
jgi:hypothetical protein